MLEETDEQPNEPLFGDIGAEQRPTEIESYCVNCGENGTTRLLLTRIPHFKEVIVMAFECPSCGARNNEIQSAGIIMPQGLVVTCKIDGKEDLNRQLVKSEFSSIRFHELDLEIPPKSGLLTTIEGLISRVIDDLSTEQPTRKYTEPTVHDQLQQVIEVLRSYITDALTPFTVSVDDPAGNSYIENLVLPADDPKLALRFYPRTREQDEALGLQSRPEDVAEAEAEAEAKAEVTGEAVGEVLTKEDGDVEGDDNDNEVPEVMSFPAQCSSCGARSETRMRVIEIPHFKEVVLMSTNCEMCGYKSNEVKAGGAVSNQGKKIKLKMEEADDLSRDILKSETCRLSIPDIHLELTPGTLGGRFTTVEGLLKQVHEELDRRAPFESGDSAEEAKRAKWSAFLERLDKVANGDPSILPVTLVLDDPLGNSYLQNLYAPDDDPNMSIELYDRDWETNEDLGLNDIMLEEYKEEGHEEVHEGEKDLEKE